MLGLKFKAFFEQMCSILSEPVRTTPGWAPKGDDLKQAEPKAKASHFQGMTLITVENQMLERRRKAKEAESQVRRRDKARSKELVQKGRDASETLLRLL